MTKNMAKQDNHLQRNVWFLWCVYICISLTSKYSNSLSWYTSHWASGKTCSEELTRHRLHLLHLLTRTISADCIVCIFCMQKLNNLRMTSKMQYATDATCFHSSVTNKREINKFMWQTQCIALFSHTNKLCWVRREQYYGSISFEHIHDVMKVLDQRCQINSGGSPLRRL